MFPTKFRFIWSSGFRGEDLNKSANQKQELPMVAMFVNGSGQIEHSLERTFHRCFLPSFTSFVWGVSEEKINMWQVNGRRTPSDGKSSHCLWQGELKKICGMLVYNQWSLASFTQEKLLTSQNYIPWPHRSGRKKILFLWGW